MLSLQAKNGAKHDKDISILSPTGHSGISHVRTTYTHGHGARGARTAEWGVCPPRRGERRWTWSSGRPGRSAEGVWPPRRGHSDSLNVCGPVWNSKDIIEIGGAVTG